MEHDIKRLVKELTQLQEGSENFRRTYDYVQSNFRFHRYLDPDSHKITRTLKGIEEKLEIHSQSDKASVLRGLVDSFLSQPLSKSAQLTKTDGHYAVLSFLLQLSNSPVNATFEEKVAQKKSEPEPTFDWTGYLLEGIQPIRSFQDSSEEEWSEEELEEEEGESPEPHASGHAPLPRSGGGGVGVYGSLCAELQESLVVRYWEGERDTTLCSQHSTHTITAHWDELDKSSRPFSSLVQRVQLTETQLVRESIWILMGAGKSYVYQMMGEDYVARDDIQVSHLTPAALHGITRRLAKLGSMVQQLQAFIDRVRSSPMTYLTGQRSKQVSSSRKSSVSSEKEAASPEEEREDMEERESWGRSCQLPEVGRGTGLGQGAPTSTPNHFTCQTYEAFAEALSRFLTEFRGHLLQEEKKVVAQEETYSLAMFVEWLESWRPLLTLAHSIHYVGVAQVDWETPSHRVFCLLQTLHRTLMEHYCLGSQAKGMLDLLWQLWVETTRPYISFITKWLMQGALYDPAQEFAICRNPDIHIKSESYWKKAFSLQSLPIDEQDGSVLSLPSNQNPENENVPLGQRGVLTAVPEFLQPVLAHVLLAGKSMEILEATGKLSRAGQEDWTDLFQLRANYQTPTLSHVPQAAVDDSRSDHVGDVTMEVGDVATMVERQLSLRGYKDPLIARGIAQVGNLDLHEGLEHDPEVNIANARSDKASLTKPLELLLYRQLYPAITARCQAVCSQLSHIIQQDFSLHQHLLALRRVFLLEAGDVMYDFYSVLFSKVRHGEAWQDPLSLNYHLQETLGPAYPQQAARIMVSVEPQRLTAKTAAQPIHALDALTLHYKVPWPVDIIISLHSLDVYNQVFRFLLQVKRALYCLQQLRFPDLMRSSSGDGAGHASDAVDDEDDELQDEPLYHALPLIHRLFLLRFRLLHFVNAVHNYLMTRILYSTGLEFSAEIEAASDLDQMLAAHRTYLAKLSERCLLHHKVAFVREAVSKVLNLALTFQRRWDAGVHTFSEENVARAEEEFFHCNEFLSTLLTNIIRRGTFPHLEALAMSLSGPRPQSKAGERYTAPSQR